MRRLARREFLIATAAAPLALGKPSAPALPVALARHRSYEEDPLPVLSRMFDQLGGLGRLVRGKTVAIKLNLGGPADRRLGHLPHERTNWVHPRVVGATLHLMDQAGARRIRLLEGSHFTAAPLAEHMYQAGWEPTGLIRAARRVELENTNTRGQGKEYFRVTVPGDAYIYPGFDLNHSYVDCDVFVSLAKLKEHVTTGVTLSMKNCFGITPTSIYGEDAGDSDPNENPGGGRGSTCHAGSRQPSKCAPSELDPASPRESTYRVPRIIVDIVAARPVDLAIIDGVESMGGNEAVFRAGAFPASAGVLIAGTNCVNTDAVAVAVMGYDPLATRGAPPFERCDSTLELAELRGLGTRDLNRIEVAGEAIRDVTYDFRAARKAARVG